MPRRKKSESPEVTTEGATAPEASNEQRSSTELFAPGTADNVVDAEFVEGALASPANGGAGTQEQGNGTQQFRPVRHTFTSDRAGVRAGEDKRFNAPQAFVDFADDQRATAEEKSELGQAGFRYRPSDKGYSALANPETRQARDDMSVKFTERRLKEKAGQGEGHDR